MRTKAVSTGLALAVVVALAGVLAYPAFVDPAQGPGVECRSQGFWKNHPDDWPVSSIVLGRESYDATEALDLLRTPPRGDASLILAHQLIAAKLNVAAGGTAAGIDAVIAEADSLLAGFAGVLPYGVRPSSSDGGSMVKLAERLDAFNNTCTATVECTPPGTAGAGDVTVLPKATGTVRFFPELGVLDRAPVGDAVQSTYFKTTDTNREFRRGFMEYEIPTVKGPS